MISPPRLTIYSRGRFATRGKLSPLVGSMHIFQFFSSLSWFPCFSRQGPGIHANNTTPRLAALDDFFHLWDFPLLVFSPQALTSSVAWEVTLARLFSRSVGSGSRKITRFFRLRPFLSVLGTVSFIALFSPVCRTRSVLDLFFPYAFPST